MDERVYTHLTYAHSEANRYEQGATRKRRQWRLVSADRSEAEMRIPVKGFESCVKQRRNPCLYPWRHYNAVICVFTV